MTPDRWQRISALYSELCELPPEEQSRRLSELPPVDSGLREEVEKILRATPAEGEGIVDHPPLGFTLSSLVTGGHRLQPGDVLANRFEIIAHRGSGGMGEVYEAEDRDLHTRVGLKVIRREVAGEASVHSRFRREIALARQVTHRSVCRVFDYFPATLTSRGERADFLTMELIEGETLAQMLTRAAPLTLAQALPFITQIAAGLDAAHAAGVLHRDLKGSNVLLTSDAEGLRVVITDFGLARSTGVGADGFTTGSAAAGAGTPLFMSPEQLEGGKVGPESDLYSFGVLMYQMATGVVPHQELSPLQLAARRVKSAPPIPSATHPGVDKRWDQVILRCLALRPADRFPDGAAVVAALHRPSLFPSARPAAALAIAAARRGSTAVMAAALLAAAGSGWWALHRWYEPPLQPVAPGVARFYNEGVTALADGSVTRASKLLERALESDPSLLSARCRLAEAYIELDMRDRAQEQMLEAVSGRARGEEERLLCDGVRAALAGQWDRAIASAQRRAQDSPASGRAFAQLDAARWSERAGRLPAAAAAYEALIAVDPSQPGALLRLATVRYQQGKNAEAQALLHRAASAYQALGNSEGLGEVALVNSRIAPSVPEAIRFAEEAERRGRETASDWLLVRAMFRHSDRLEAQGDFPAARRLTLEGIAIAERAGLAGQAVDGLLDLGYAPFAQGRYEEAEADYRKALQLAGRYRARRAEARARLFLAQWHMKQNQLDQAAPLLDQAVEYFRTSGSAVQVANTLRIRGELYEKAGRFDEARAAVEDSLKASPAPNDQLLGRRQLAFFARQQTRYEDAAAGFAEVVRAAEAIGDRSAVQTYLIEKARVLILLGRFREASADLESVRNGPPAGEGIGNTLEAAQASLEFQQMAFDRSLRRMEALRARARQAGRLAEERGYGYSLCAYYAEAWQPARSIPLCEAARQEFAARPAQLLSIHQSLALDYLALRVPAKAAAAARQALTLTEQIRDQRNTWYSLLILAEALHQSNDAEWRQARRRAETVFQEIARQGGESAIGSYLSRPLIARRKQTVDRLQ